MRHLKVSPSNTVMHPLQQNREYFCRSEQITSSEAVDSEVESTQRTSSFPPTSSQNLSVIAGHEDLFFLSSSLELSDSAGCWVAYRWGFCDSGHSNLNFESICKDKMFPLCTRESGYLWAFWSSFVQVIPFLLWYMSPLPSPDSDRKC